LKALDWIKNFPNDFEVFSKDFLIFLPIPVLTSEEKIALQKQQEEEAKKAQELLALEANKKNKNTKTDATKKNISESSPPIDATTTKRPTELFFNANQQLELNLVCAQFLLEIAMLEAKISSKDAKILESIGNDGLNILTIVASNLSKIFNKLTSFQDKNWVYLYGKNQLLKNKFYIHCRKLRMARASVSNFIVLLHSNDVTLHSSTNNYSNAIVDSNNNNNNNTTHQNLTTHSNDLFSGDLFGIVTQFYFQARHLLIQISEKQARFEDAVFISTQSLSEASVLFCGYWLRLILLSRAEANFKLGKLKEARVDCDACIELFTSHQVETLSLVKVLILKASVLRENALFDNRSKAKTSYIESLWLIRKAKEICEKLVKKSGGFDADTNALLENSFDTNNTNNDNNTDTSNNENENVMKHHLISPFLYSFTTMHSNEAELSKKFIENNTSNNKDKKNKKNLNKQNTIASTNSNIKHDQNQHNNNAITITIDKNNTNSDSNLMSKEDIVLNELRLSVLDETENIFVTSSFFNIYLAEVKILIICHVALCSQLDDARASGACSELILCDEVKNKHEKEDFNNEKKLLIEQAVAAENGLKVFFFFLIYYTYTIYNVYICIACV
jgi:hypothetical protein